MWCEMHRIRSLKPSMQVMNKATTDEKDFEALDRLARGITPAKRRPLTAEQRARWEAAKRGRPKKASGTKAVPTLITVEPQLLRLADAYAKKAGVSRSQLFSDAVGRVRLFDRRPATHALSPETLRRDGHTTGARGRSSITVGRRDRKQLPGDPCLLTDPIILARSMRSASIRNNVFPSQGRRSAIGQRSAPRWPHNDVA